MEYLRRRSEEPLEEMLAEYEARMYTALDWGMEDRGEEIYHRATAFIQLAEDMDYELDPDRIDSLRDSLDEFEERYLEPDDEPVNRIDPMAPGNNPPPAL